MLAFLRKPKWLLLGALVVVMVVAFISLGFWQLGRLQQVRDENQHILATRAAVSTPVQQLMRVGAPPAAANEYRKVTATGRWDTAHQILVRYRQIADDNGLYVLTPLVLADGNRVLIARGWIPPGPRASIEQPVPAPVAGADGTVTVTGRVRLPEGGDPHQTTVGKLVSVTRIDPATLPAGGPVYDGYVELVSQNPPVTGQLPQLIPQGTLSEGNHESYAYQWFTFGVMAVAGYVLLAMLEVRKRRRERANQPESPEHVTVDV
ncbi:SURF1 family protein [Fodinicola acaciae]|uniref:SURF1 family cytochrome oxidase biogenesis protein n=1 Tax=Fodinicola acaciae TaxID=2681555 RepID=UPI0013D12856|nr:SURF1 family protein [Fodinicola acaciae]